MARKRRRSGSVAAAGAGASGWGPFGFFLAFCAVALIVEYWWFFLICIGGVALTVALVRRVKAPDPPVTVRQPRPAPTPEPKALDGEDLAARLRADKRRRHVRAVQEWDYEWLRLAYPGKSNRELSEIANALFAMGWSASISTTGATPSPRPHDARTG